MGLITPLLEGSTPSPATIFVEMSFNGRTAGCLPADEGSIPFISAMRRWSASGSTRLS